MLEQASEATGLGLYAVGRVMSDGCDHVGLRSVLYLIVMCSRFCEFVCQGVIQLIEHSSHSLSSFFCCYTVLSRPVSKGTLISEYRGTVVTRETLCRELLLSDQGLTYLCRTPSPFVLLPPWLRGASHAACGVDARRSGSPARFVRRSCSPNAEIRTLWRRNMPRFAVLNHPVPTTSLPPSSASASSSSSHLPHTNYLNRYLPPNGLMLTKKQQSHSIFRGECFKTRTRTR